MESYKHAFSNLMPLMPYKISSLTQFVSGIVLLAIGMLAFVCAAAVAEENAAQSAVQPRLVKTDVDSVFERFHNDVHRFVLPNGLRVLFFKRTHAPVFAAQIWVKVGGVDEKPGSTGLAHFLEHMAFKGTKTIGTKDYPKEKELLDELEQVVHSTTEDRSSRLEELYAELAEVWNDNEFSKLYKKRGAVGLNAGTGKDFTYYTIKLPNKAFEFWCWMESDRLLNPVFRQFYKERKVIREERRMRTDDSPGGKLYESLLATAYQAHPNRLPTIGWPSDMENLSRVQMEEFYNTYYRPDNMVISIVGDLEAEEVKEQVARYFSRFPPRSEPLPQIKTREEPQQGPRSVRVEFDAKPQLILAYHKPVYPHRDDLHFAIMHSLLSDGASSILHKELVLDKRLAASVYTSEAPGERYPSLFIVGAVPREHVEVDHLIKEIQAILDRMKKVTVSQKQLEAAKRRVRVSFLHGLKSNSGLAYLLGKNEVLWGDWKVLMEMYEIMAETTAEDIRRLANSYFNVRIRTDARIVPLPKKAAAEADTSQDVAQETTVAEKEAGDAA